MNHLGTVDGRAFRSDDGAVFGLDGVMKTDRLHDPVQFASLRTMTTARANGTDLRAAVVKDLLVATNRCAEQV